MTITVKKAREILEAAQQNYSQCAHRDVSEAKSELDNARYEYWHACAALCSSLEFKTSLAQVESELVNQGLWT